MPRFAIVALMIAVLGCSQSGETPSSDSNSKTESQSSGSVDKKIMYRPVTTPNEFREQWNAAEYTPKLIEFPSAALANLNISDETKQFLTEIGLPEDASPFLSFEAPASGLLETAAGQWGLSADYNRYHVIGSTGSGAPICIDAAEDGRVIYLNQDESYRPVFINSSVLQLAESLLAYRHLVSETQNQNGEDAYLDGNIPDDLKRWLQEELKRIDSAAVAAGCHWSDELTNLSQLAK